MPGKYTDLSRAEEIHLYSIRAEANAIWQQVETLPRYRQRNIAKMLRSIINNTSAVLNAHGDSVSSMPENCDPLEQFHA